MNTANEYFTLWKQPLKIIYNASCNMADCEYDTGYKSKLDAVNNIIAHMHIHHDIEEEYLREKLKL